MPLEGVIFLPGESILMVDDEKEIRELVGMYMVREGFTYLEASTGSEAMGIIQEKNPNIILLDIFLPDVDGVELCRQIRRFSTTPILFVSCKDTELDKVIGLSAGGDDYISKPFSPNELVARAKAHLRRLQFTSSVTYDANKSESKRKKLISDSITLDLNSHVVLFLGEEIYLSAKEFQLLSFLMEHKLQVFSSEHLLEKVWGFESTIDNKTVIVHIGNLRKKLRSKKINHEIIMTVRGAGYKFCEKVNVV